jgi:hypothetical protein
MSCKSARCGRATACETDLHGRAAALLLGDAACERGAASGRPWWLPRAGHALVLTEARKGALGRRMVGEGSPAGELPLEAPYGRRGAAIFARIAV